MRSLLLLLLGFALVALGLFLGQKSFQNLQEARHLQSYLSPQLAGVLPGPAILHGRIEQPEAPPFVTEAGQHCIYHSRRVEQRETRDNRTYWNLVSARSHLSPLLLTDRTGSLRIVAPEDLSVVAPEISRTSLSGGRRAREFCISPGDEVTISGLIQPDRSGLLEVHFDENARYGAAIRTSQLDWEEKEASFTSFLLLVLAILALSFGGWCFVAASRSPSYAVFSLTQCIVLFPALTFLGWNATINELTANAVGIQETLTHTEAAILDLLPGDSSFQADWSVPWDFEASPFDTLSPQDLQRIQTLRTNAAEGISQARSQLRSPPLLVVAFTTGTGRLPALRLSQTEEETLLRPPSRSSSRALGFGTFTILSLILLFFAPLFTWLGFRRIRQVRASMNLPTSSVEGLTYGGAEIKGTVVESPEFGTLSSRGRDPFVFLTDNAHPRPTNLTRPAPIPRVKDKHHAGVPFYCEDPTGRILIDPNGADLVSRHKVRRNNILYLQPGDPLYVVAAAKIDPQTGALFLGAGDDKDLPFYLSNYSERETRFRLSRVGSAMLAIGSTTSAGFLIAGYGLLFPFSPTLFFTASLGISAYLTLLAPIFLYNDLIFLRRRVLRNRSNIDVALKTRFDLITNLQEVVQTHLSHEKDLQALLSTDRAIDAHALREAYPALATDQAFLHLMDALSATEDALSMMRSGYHDAVELYNTRRSRFPHLLLATFLGFGPPPGQPGS